MRKSHARVLAIIITASLVSIVIYGAQFNHSRKPEVNITGFHLDVQYSGQYSNYINISLANSSFKEANGFPESPYYVFGFGGNWFIGFNLSITMDKGSSLYSSMQAEGYVPNNSVVLDQVEASQAGISFQSLGGNSGDPLDLLLNPLVEAIYPMVVAVGTSYFNGPLTLAFYFSSPAKNIIQYNPRVDVNYNLTNPYGVFVGPSSYGGISTSGGKSAALGGHELKLSVELESFSNFMLTGVNISSPFLLAGIGSARLASNNLTVLNGTTVHTDIYHLFLILTVDTPQYPYDGLMEITVNVNNPF